MHRRMRWSVWTVALCGLFGAGVATAAPPAVAPPLTTPAAPSAAPERPQARVLRDRVYATVDGKDLLLDLYIPTARPPEDGFPVVLWIHGGGWEAGSKDGAPAGALIRAGYAVAAINYRLSQVAKFPAQLHDAKAAVRWVRAHAEEHGLDGDRIAAWGASAGGHLAALLGTTAGDASLDGTVGEHDDQRTEVQAVVNFFGPIDLAGVLAAPPDAGERTEAARRNNPVYRLFGKLPEDAPDLYAQATPLTHITPGAPPFLIMHGDRDRLVPLDHSRRLHEALVAAGVHSTFKVVEGAGHDFSGRGTGADVVRFLDEVLKAEPVPAGGEGSGRGAGRD